MMTRKIVSYCSAVVLICFLGACGSQKTSSSTSRKEQKSAVPPRAERLSENDQRRYDYFFLEASRLQNAEKYDAAFDLLTHCLEIDSLAAEPYYMLAMYYSELNNDSIALSYLQKATNLNPDNDTYHERLAQYYIGLKRYDEATVAYENLLKSHSQRVDVLNILLQLYNQQKNYDQMLATIERIEQIEGVSEETSLSKMRVYELKEDKKKAYKTLKELSDKHPSDVNYKVMMGNWLLSNGDKKQAFNIFNNALVEEPDNGYAQSSMYDYYKREGMDSMATVLRDDILLSSKTPVKTKMTMLQQIIRECETSHGDSTEVLQIFDKMREINPKETDVAMLEALYMSLKNMPQDTINHLYRHILNIEPDRVGARLPLIQEGWNKQQWDKVIDLCKTGTQYNPEEMAFYYYMGMAYNQEDNIDGALDAFRRGVGEITDKTDPSLASDFYAIMGDILHEKGLVEESFAAYDSCLHWKDSNIPCLNNYAYFLSVENRDLSRAEQMSYRAVKAEPLNATYLDTYAWILFMQERYAESKVYIDQALKNDTDSVQSAVVIEHAGDIYFMNGHPDEAVDYWQKSLVLGNDSALLVRKIKLKKYISDEKE